MKTMSLADAQALALRHGGTLAVGGREFNSAGAVAAPSRQKPPIQAIADAAEPAGSVLLEALRMQAESFTGAITKLVESIGAPAASAAEPLAAFARARAAESKAKATIEELSGQLASAQAKANESHQYDMDVVRDNRTDFIHEVVVSRDGVPRYLATPEIDQETGLISRFSINPIGHRGPSYQ